MAHLIAFSFFLFNRLCLLLLSRIHHLPANKLLCVSSNSVSSSVSIFEFLKAAMEPLQWVHLYLPWLPPCLGNDLLACPFPFLAGIHRSQLESQRDGGGAGVAISGDVVYLDIDSSAVHIPASLLDSLRVGRRLVKALDAVLRPNIIYSDDARHHYASAESHSVEKRGSTILRLCREFVSEILAGSGESMTVIKNEAYFDESAFLEIKARTHKPLLSQSSDFFRNLLRTQHWSEYISRSIGQERDDGRPREGR